MPTQSIFEDIRNDDMGKTNITVTDFYHNFGSENETLEKIVEEGM